MSSSKHAIETLDNVTVDYTDREQVVNHFRSLIGGIESKKVKKADLLLEINKCKGLLPISKTKQKWEKTKLIQYITELLSEL